jgi:hypothetical protein
MRRFFTTATLLATLALAPAAQAAEPIEGTWHFNGGEVLVKATGPGTFEGTVIKRTQFANCPHLPGERMWQITGSGTEYRGTHNYLRNADCSIEPGGQATWRIISTDAAAFRLEFCSANPGRGAPTPDNPATACSTLTRARPPEPKVTPTVRREAFRELPSTKRCKSRRAFRIRVRQLRDVLYREVKVTVRGRSVRVRRVSGRHVATIDLRRLPAGRFTVKIAVTTAEGQRLRGTRRYRTCAPKRRPGTGRPRL